MAILKRKRSDSELSFSSQLSSPPRPSDTCFFPMGGVNLFPSARSPTRSNVGGRTMKRFRDNRPSQEEIHRNTLELMYSAQRQSTQADPHMSPDCQPRHQQSAVSASSSRQTSLHSFWKLPKQSQASHTLPTSLQTPPPGDCATGCEDCGRDLRGEDDAAMDIDGDGWCGSESCSCSSCGKTVCSSCSVSNLGANRQCLACAGRSTGRGRWGAGLHFG